MGAMRYQSLELRTGGASDGTVYVLRTHRDPSELYVGEDVELLIQRGILSLERVLEVDHDHEKYSLKMLAAAPDSKVALANLIEIYSAKGEFEKAAVLFERLHEKYPDVWEMGVTLGFQLVDAKKFRQAADVFRKVVGARREYEALYGLGYALAWSGQKNEAAVYLKEATELDPTDFRAFYSLGYVYRDTGRYAEAKREWSRVLELIPHFPEVQSNLRSIESRIRR
jgi:tetratricopeptide (TPR) repeat protein